VVFKTKFSREHRPYAKVLWNGAPKKVKVLFMAIIIKKRVESSLGIFFDAEICLFFAESDCLGTQS